MYVENSAALIFHHYHYHHYYHYYHHHYHEVAENSLPEDRTLSLCPRQRAFLLYLFFFIFIYLYIYILYLFQAEGMVAGLSSRAIVE